MQHASVATMAASFLLECSPQGCCGRGAVVVATIVMVRVGMMGKVAASMASNGTQECWFRGC